MMSLFHTRKLLTVITESAIERDLCADLEALGAHGYTITDARGKGRQGVREATWDPSGNIRLEVVCKEDTANVIAGHLTQKYYANYAMILYLSDVQVVRSEKF
jgi:nitrogen regulatory protein PII